MGVGNTVMIVGLGDLGGWVLEFLARRSGVTTIIGCDKREDWGSRKVNVAASGSGTEGYSKTLKFEKVDVADVDGTAELIAKYKPDLIYSSLTLMSWTVLGFFPHDVHEDLKKIAGTYLPMHTLLPYKLAQAIKASGTDAVYINNSWPDLVNPLLYRNGFNVAVGSGNLDNVVAEIGRKVSVKENVPIRDVKIYAVFEHSVNVMGTRTGVPAYLKVMIGDKDITKNYDVNSLISDRLMGGAPPEWVSWIVHPQVAATAVKTIMAFVNDTNELTHAPGPNGMIGGYPIRIGAKGVTLDLPEGMSEEQAIEINRGGARAEGVEDITADGTVILTERGTELTKKYLGVDLKQYVLTDIPDLVGELRPAFKRLSDEYNVKMPMY